MILNIQYTTIFKENVWNCSEVLNFIDREPEKLYNELKETAKNIDREESKLDSRTNWKLPVKEAKLKKGKKISENFIDIEDGNRHRKNKESFSKDF